MNTTLSFHKVHHISNVSDHFEKLPFEKKYCSPLSFFKVLKVSAEMH